MAIEVIETNVDAVLLWQVACEFVGASKKLAASGLTRAEAWQILDGYLETFELVTPSPAVLGQAQALHLKRQWSFWDALLIGACVEAGVQTLFSEDLPGSSPPEPLKIVNPLG